MEYARDVIALLDPGVAPQPELPMPVIEGEANISAMEVNDGN